MVAFRRHSKNWPQLLISSLSVLVSFLIFNENCSTATRFLSNNNENTPSVLLRMARDARKTGLKPSKAARYYKEIIDSPWRVDAGKEDTLDRKSSDLESHESVISEALYELSEMLESSHENPSAISEGFAYLTRAASMGHVKAQHRLASAYATGLFGTGLVPMNAGRALLLEHMAALGGSPEAAMGMGNRYLYGIGVPEDCEKARVFYELAANEAADQIRRRGLPLHSERVKISDTEIAASNGRKNIDTEVVDYYKHLVSGGGDNAAAHTLGGMYLQGSRFIEQDLQKALHYLSIASDTGDVAASGQLGYLKAQQLSFKLGNMKRASVKTETLLEENSAVKSETSHPPKQSSLITEVKAIMKLLRYASNRGDVNGQLGMGYMHFAGLSETAEDSAQGRVRNISAAFNSFSKLQSKHVDAGFYIGEILMGRAQPGPESPTRPSASKVFGPPIRVPRGAETAQAQIPSEAEHNGWGKLYDGEVEDDTVPPHLVVKIDPVAAMRAYKVSWQRGNLLALHRISHMAAEGVGMVRSCSTAVTGFKAVAERGDWAHGLTRAHRLIDAGDRKSALALFSTLAAIGVESAQFNTAYILMKTTDLPWLQLPPAVTPNRRQEDVVQMEISPSGDTLSAPAASAATIGSAESTDSTVQPKKEGWATNPSTRITAALSTDITYISDQADEVLAQAGAKANCQARALALYAVSATQSSSESLLRVGDCFYYGCGGLDRDRVEAYVFYQLAADLRNTHAIFNLGLMHEVGDGVQQDFHLAKRFYDMAAVADADAKLPRAVALLLLSWHRSMQEHLGAPFTDAVIELAVSLSRSVEGILKAGMVRVRQMLSEGDVPASGGKRPGGRDTRGKSVESLADVLRSVQGSLKRSVLSISAPAFPGRAGFGDAITLLGLGFVFLFIVRWKRRRQQQR